MDHSQLPEQGSENTGHHIPQEDSSTLTTHQQFFHLRNMQDISIGIAEDFSGHNQFQSIGNNFSATLGASEPSKKRNASSMEITVHDQDVHKRLRLETCGMNDQVIPTFNEEGSMDLDSEMDIGKTSSQIEIDDSHLTGINPSLLSENQTFQSCNCIANISDAINTNTFQNDIAAYKSSLPESSKVNNVCSVEDMQILPGPSEELRYTPPQSPFETLKDPSICFLCQKKVSEHWVALEGIEYYSCCGCGQFFRDNSIRDHIYFHCPITNSKSSYDSDEM